MTREIVDGLAFLPENLPKEITLNTETWTRVNNATAALARLDGAARLIPEPRVLRKPTLRREAQSTSALEGTFAPFVDVLAADETDDRSLSAEVREVLNFEAVAELAFGWPEDRRVTIPLLGELQARLVRRTAGELSDSGDIRDRIVVIGNRNSGFSGARFIPPPPGDQLRAGVESLLEWIANPPDLPSVIHAAMVHYQFETLHPFSDGNGRLGRLFVIVQLLRGAVIREPLLVVSPWFEARREQYQDQLLALSCTGDWNEWISFFATGVEAAATESRIKVEKLLALQQEYVERVDTAGKRGVPARLAPMLIGKPTLTAREASSMLKVTTVSGRHAVNALVDLEILKATDIKVGNGAQLFMATDVFNIIAG